MDNSQDSMQIHDVVRQLVAEESVTVTVTGDCMNPWIENDVQVQISQARFYWPGDVVVVLSHNGQYLAHRVIGVYRRTGKFKIITQADSSQRPDAATRFDAVLGKVTGGSCHPHVISVPLSHRFKASFRFVRFFTAYLFKSSNH